MKSNFAATVLIAALAVGLFFAGPARAGMWGDFLAALSPASVAPVKSRLIAPDVARFIAEGTDESALPPSFSLIVTPGDAGPVPAGWKDAPQFTVGKKRFSAFVPIAAGTSLYGAGETAGPLERNGRVTVTWNSDNPSYGERTKSLYQTHPWVLAVRADGSAFGVLADTSYRATIDLRGGIRFTTEGRPFPVYIIEADSPQKVVMRLSDLTGKMALPALWTLGYQQCRWSYYPDARVREIADNFRSRHIPCDVIWLDIHYMDGYRIFTFDQSRFPDPKGLNDYLHAKNFKTVWMIDPGVKKDPGYFVYDQGLAGDHFVKTKNGDVFIGSVWPGPCAFPDFTRPETRAWWGTLYEKFLATGIDGVWNDMNEPSVFTTATRTMPVTNVHRGGGDLPPGDHALYHNVYGMLMARSTQEAVARINPDKRPFVLTRSNYIGGQRYAATWTGDNVASWAHLRYSIAMVLNFGLSGQPFSGPDIGGFSGKGTPEMFARWMGIGAFFPFSRGHAAQGNIDKEPWAFGEDVEKSVRVSLQRRYRLLPYLYTVFREASVTGLPVMRPLFFADPKDPALRNEIGAFLVGADLMVVGQVAEDNSHRPALPKGIWRPFSLVGESPAADVNHPELRIRGGVIIPAGRVVESAAEKMLDPLTLLVSLDADGKASGVLYEDAGDGYGYRDGDYLLTQYKASLSGGVVTVEVFAAEGKMTRPERKVVVEVITDQGVVKGEGSENAPIKISL